MPNRENGVRREWKSFPRRISHAPPTDGKARAQMERPKERTRVQEHELKQTPRSFRQSQNRRLSFFRVPMRSRLVRS